MGSLATKTNALLACFGVYIGFLFIFGALYYVLYRRRPKYFLFNVDIQEQQKHTFSETLLRRAKNIRRHINRLSVESQALRHLVNQIDKGISLSDLSERKQRVSLPSGIQYLVERELLESHGEVWVSVWGYRITVYDPAGTSFQLPERYATIFEGDWVSTFRGLAEERTNIAREEEKQAEAYEHQARNNTDYQRIWSYWDFFYFSAIAQTTVGFGDILPNHTLVRMLVVLQILIGYGVLVVLLNVVLMQQ